MYANTVLASSPGRQLKFKRWPGLHCNSVSAHALAITKKSGNRITFLVCTPFRTPSRFQCKLFLVPDPCVCRVLYVSLLSHAPWTKFLPLRLVRVGWLIHATNCAENSCGAHSLELPYTLGKLWWRKGVWYRRTRPLPMSAHHESTVHIHVGFQHCGFD